MNPLIPTTHIILLAIPVLVCAGLISWRTARRASPAVRVAMTVSRILAVAGIVALLLNPGAKRERLQELDESWAIMLDRSASMAFADVERGSRWDAARDIAAEAFDLSGNTDNVHLYTFSETTTGAAPGDLDSMQPDGADTRIVLAGRSLLSLEKSRGSSLRGILLLSDGRQPVRQSPETFSLQAAARGVPIYPIVLGGDVPFKDLEVSIPRLRHVSFVGQPIAISGSVINKRLGPVQTDVILRDAHQRIVARKSFLVKDNQEVAFRFNLTRETPGYYEYWVEAPLRQAEADRANNAVGLGVFVLAERLNVLLLEGEPHWDTKFLSHLLRVQDNMALTAVFRVTQQRFFKVSTTEAMTASDSDAFPKTAEALGKYDLVVLGRGAEYFIDAERAALLEDFVKNQGGCLFFARGKSYAGTESHLQGLEPVKWGRPIEADFSMQPLLGGEHVGLFGGLLPGRDHRLWQDLPSLRRAHDCTQLRSFATVLADGVVNNTRGKAFPLLISKRYGRGLVLLINGDGLWRWGFFPEVADQSDVYQNLWIRLFQWAVSFTEFNPGADYLIRTDRSMIRIGEPLGVRVRARAHVKPEKLVVRVYRNETLVHTLSLADESAHQSAWSGLVTPASQGIYRLAVETPAGEDLGAQTTIQVLAPPGESDDLSADAAFLETLATQSGGRIITRDALSDMVAEFETRTKSVQAGDVSWEALWDKAWVMTMLMLLFSLEWYWRRRQGLR